MTLATDDTGHPAASRAGRSPVARPRRYVMCRPTHFTVDYAINPWMTPGATVDRDRALQQWEALRGTYRTLGHEVALLPERSGLPDMVFVANGALVVDGRVLIGRFAHAERAPEAGAHRSWLLARGYREVHDPDHVHEGEGDMVVVGERILAGTGFRTSRQTHSWAADLLQRPVITLELADPRYYHLDVALVALDDDTVAYYPGAFSSASRTLLRDLYPDAVLATQADAEVLGLNAVSDGRHVVLPAEARDLRTAVAERGYVPVPVELDEFRKAGGGPKCCTLELRA